MVVFLKSKTNFCFCSLPLSSSYAGSDYLTHKGHFQSIYCLIKQKSKFFAWPIYIYSCISFLIAELISIFAQASESNI